MAESHSSAAIAVAVVAVASVCIGAVVAFIRPSGKGGDAAVDDKAKSGTKHVPTPEGPPAVKPNGATRATPPAPASTGAPPPPVPRSSGARPAGSASGGGGGAGGGAVLARLRQQREASAAAAAAKAAAALAAHPVAFLFASQTGTAEEIAHSLFDEALGKDVKATVHSLDEFKFENLTPEKAPVVVVVAASTGDGEAPDNASRAFLSFKKTAGSGQLKGMQFTVMGLGDSNYSKFMEVPRVIKRKLLEYGASEFYPSAEADEVDGLEDIVDAWKDAIWQPLQAAVAPQAQPSADAGSKSKGSEGGGKAAALPETYTKEGGLLSSEAVIDGVPALRISRTIVHMGAAMEEVAGHALQPTEEQLAYRDETGHYSEEHPFYAKLVESRSLTRADCGKRVLHVSLDVAGAGMQFTAGDAFTLHPCNDPALVKGLLSHLDAEGSQVVSAVEWTDGTTGSAPLPHVRTGHSLEHNLLWACDVTSPPSKALLVALAAVTADERQAATLRFLASRDGRAAYKCDILEGRPSLLQLLTRYSTCRPTVPRLLELLPPLRPRQYSLANAPAATPDRFECAFRVVEFSTHWGAHGGVATTWLARQVAAPSTQHYPVSLRPSTGFRPPSDAAAPIIMVGPGTGVAPFRGFLQQRRAQRAAGAALGESWLFFGNWKEDDDFLYGSELKAFAAEGTLSHLVTAWSRAGPDKVYVQHLMKQHGKQLCKALMEEEGSVFVCGDGAHMAAGVHAALKEIVQEHGDFDASEADTFLHDLSTAKRYMKDIWT